MHDLFRNATFDKFFSVLLLSICKCCTADVSEILNPCLFQVQKLRHTWSICLNVRKSVATGRSLTTKAQQMSKETLVNNEFWNGMGVYPNVREMYKNRTL